MRWPARTDKERFLDKVEQPAYSAACWLWRAGKSSDGYGSFGFRGAMRGTHRVAWILFRGEIPDGLIVCHRCDNPGCVNPDHLFLGTHQDNADDKMRKGRHTWANKTHCAHGHPLSGDNLYVNSRGARVCRECARMHGRMYDRTKRDRPRKVVAA